MGSEITGLTTLSEAGEIWVIIKQLFHLLSFWITFVILTSPI